MKVSLIALALCGLASAAKVQVDLASTSRPMVLFAGRKPDTLTRGFRDHSDHARKVAQHDRGGVGRVVSYQFDDIPDGDHVLAIAAPNFNPGAPRGVIASVFVDGVPVKVTVDDGSWLAVKSSSMLVPGWESKPDVDTSSWIKVSECLATPERDIAENTFNAKCAPLAAEIVFPDGCDTKDAIKEYYLRTVVSVRNGVVSPGNGGSMIEEPIPVPMPYEYCVSDGPDADKARCSYGYQPPRRYFMISHEMAFAFGVVAFLSSLITLAVVQIFSVYRRNCNRNFQLQTGYLPVKAVEACECSGK